MICTKFARSTFFIHIGSLGKCPTFLACWYILRWLDLKALCTSALLQILSGHPENYALFPRVEGESICPTTIFPKSFSLTAWWSKHLGDVANLFDQKSHNSRRYLLSLLPPCVPLFSCTLAASQSLPFSAPVHIEMSITWFGASKLMCLGAAL